MKVRTEFLNFLTGILLELSGALNIWQGNFEMGMSWIIFGAMYLVMGDYIQNERLNTWLEKLTDASRQIFSCVGLFGSAVLLRYYVIAFLNN